MTPDRSDAELVEAWGAGDRAAGGELVRRYGVRLRRFFVHRAGDQSEDLVQATFLECLRARARLRDATAFRSFLFGIAYNVLRSSARRQRTEGERSPDVSGLVGPGTTASGALARRRDRAQLAHALRQLPLDLQVALQLHYWEEMTAAEIGQALGWPLGTVKTRLRRARRELTEALRTAAALPASQIDLARTLRGWLGEVGDGEN